MKRIFGLFVLKPKQYSNTKISIRLSLKLCIYICITLFIQYIWHDCTIPQEMHSAFNSSNENTKCVDKSGFHRAGHFYLLLPF